MIDLRFRPVDKPIKPPTGGHKRGRFGCAWGTLLNDLEIELRHLKASDIIVEADLRLDQIRQDGWLRGGCSPASPGVRLSFVSRHGPLAYTCATFDTMEQNLRAIGMTLQRLRLVDEYGTTKSGEQYRGFSALPPGGIAAPEFASVEDAARFLLQMAGSDYTHAGNISCVLAVGHPSCILDRVYRKAATMNHPDAGGTEKAMSRINRARDFIKSSAACASSA